MYAQIKENEITAIGRYPRLEFDGVRWWDLRDEAVRISRGWLEVQETPKPEDTAEVTHDRSVELVEGSPVVVWTERPWTAEELAAQADAAAQQFRYETHEAILDATAALMEQAHTDGETWTQPTGAHDAYPLGATVTHGDKTWENITPANVWEPGDSGWREQVSEGYPAWVQPTGGHDAYSIGDRVSFEGANYESLIDANVWSPTGYPQGWTLIP